MCGKWTSLQNDVVTKTESEFLVAEGMAGRRRGERAEEAVRNLPIKSLSAIS